MSGRGAPALHQALAAYLNRVRGTSARPDHIVICNGYAQGIALLIQTLALSGAKRLALEDPSADDDALPLARAAGLEVVGVPVDEDGVSVDALDRTDADALVLTPSHQWPTGAVLSAERRAAVLRWARKAASARHRGRLRRRVPLRPRSDRGHAGSRAGPRRLRRDREQDARARTAAGLARRARRPRRRHRRRQEARRSRLARPGSAGLRRLRGPRGVRSPPAPDASSLPAPPRRAARSPPASTPPSSSRPGSPRGCTSSPTCRAASTRRPSSRPPPGAAWLCTGWRPIASPARAGRGSSSATRPSVSARSPRGSRCWPR